MEEPIGIQSAESDHPLQGARPSFAKGPELVSVLMQSVSNPHMLFSLVSSTTTAKAQRFAHLGNADLGLPLDIYETWPSSHLATSLLSLPDDIQQLATAYIAIAEQEPQSDGIPTRDRTIGEFLEGDSCQDRQSEVTQFLDQYLGGHQGKTSFPQHLPNPLQTLKKLNAVYESIDLLATSYTWKSSLQMENTGFKSIGHRIRCALWRLQIFCSLFHEDCLADKTHVCDSKCARTSQSDQCDFQKLMYRVYRTTLLDQTRFFHTLNMSEVEDLARVYDDLSLMLHQVYDSWLALIFEESYLEECKVTPLGWWGNKVAECIMVDRAEDSFLGHINYRMSLGLQYLAEMYRSKSPHIVPIKEEAPETSNSYTELFFVPAVRDHSCAGYKWRHYPYTSGTRWLKSNHYQLRPGGVDHQGWRLKIRYGTHELAFTERNSCSAQTIMVNQDFSPPYLGRYGLADHHNGPESHYPYWWFM